MSNKTIITKTALCYAEVLYELCPDIEKAGKMFELLESNELCLAFSSRAVNFSEKCAVIDRLFEKEVTGFLKTLCKNDEYSVLGVLSAAYKMVWNKHNSVLEAELCFAEVIPQNSIDGVKAMLAEKYGVKSVELKLVEDKELIGGFKLFVNDKVYDKSVSGILDRMRRQLVRG